MLYDFPEDGPTEDGPEGEEGPTEDGAEGAEGAEGGEEGSEEKGSEGSEGSEEELGETLGGPNALPATIADTLAGFPILFTSNIFDIQVIIYLHNNLHFIPYSSDLPSKVPI